ncbi:MAG TPA: cyclodeaminase/cyclohydrolase family protein [Caldilineaceae bacterium]|nr:cyclodeaminase/cyclohydrolase family protein [Caldilineaceae bacterium]
MKIGEMTVAALLDALAAKQSTPGGGGAAAVTGSQAAALLSMVANFTLGNKKYAAVQEEMERHLAASEALRRELLALADADADAFARVAAGYAMPRETEEQKEARSAALQAALRDATQVPLATAQKALAVIRLVAPVAAAGNPNVVSDAATALYLAEAALHAALVNVNINLKFLKDETFVRTTAEQRDRLLAEAAEAGTAGRLACREGLGFEL